MAIVLKSENLKIVKINKVTKDLCDCGGEMLPTGNILMSNPPKFPHECEKCGKSVSLLERYPTVRWEEVEIK